MTRGKKQLEKIVILHTQERDLHLINAPFQLAEEVTSVKPIENLGTRSAKIFEAQAGDIKKDISGSILQVMNDTQQNMTSHNPL